MSGHLSSSSLLPSLASSPFPHDLKSPLLITHSVSLQSHFTLKGEREKEGERKGRRGIERGWKIQIWILNVKIRRRWEPLFRIKTTASWTTFFLLAFHSPHTLWRPFLSSFHHSTWSPLDLHVTLVSVTLWVGGKERIGWIGEEGGEREIEEGRKSLDTFSCVSKSRGRKKSRVEEAERMTWMCVLVYWCVNLDVHFFFLPEIHVFLSIFSLLQFFLSLSFSSSSASIIVSVPLKVFPLYFPLPFCPRKNCDHKVVMMIIDVCIQYSYVLFCSPTFFTCFLMVMDVW